jgi:hypothetical protein
MRIEGDWGRDGILVVRQLFDAGRVARLLDISNRLLDMLPGRAEAKSQFQIHHPKYFAVGSPELHEILEATACPDVCVSDCVYVCLSTSCARLHAVSERDIPLSHGRLELVRQTCSTKEPMFSHTSLFFNPEAPRAPASVGHGLPGSSSCCGEWHRDAQYIHPEEEKEKQLVLHAEAVMGGEMMQIQCALLPSRHFEYVRGSHNRWDTEEELFIRKGGNNREHRFSDEMPGAAVRSLARARARLTHALLPTAKPGPCT